MCPAETDDLQCPSSPVRLSGERPEESLRSMWCLTDRPRPPGREPLPLPEDHWRITQALGLVPLENIWKKLPQSFLLSADNAHGCIPLCRQECDPVNRPDQGGGVVVKNIAEIRSMPRTRSLRQSSVSGEKGRGEAPGVYQPLRIFPAGPLGEHLPVQHVPVKTADVGTAQLAMHSPYETCGMVIQRSD